MPPEAFDQLYAETFRRVWGALGRAGIRSEVDREDLAQDIYLAVHENLPKRNPEAPEIAWVLTIADHVASNHRRLKRTQEERPVDDPEAILDKPSEAPPADEVLAARHRYFALVEGMPDDRRRVFELHEVEGFSIPEVAAALGIAEGTAYTRLRLAREHVAAAEARLAAREQRPGRRPSSAALLVPFVPGGWLAVRGLFDDVPEGAEQAVRRGVQRTLAHAARVAGGAAGAAVAGKAAGALVASKAAALFGSGFGMGGVVVGGVVYVLLTAEPAPHAPMPVAVPVRPLVVAAPAGTASADAPGATPPEVATSTAAASNKAAASRPAVSTSATATAAGSRIDPEEVALISRATVAFARRDRAGVEEALAAHARRFPHGAMAHDREEIRAKLGELGPAGTNKGPTPDGGRGRVFGSED
jgi:RNA polymerase sigma-70 factor, ECF subfamily